MALTLSTFAEPDEHWQSREIARYFLTNSANLTWEWMHKIRSFAFPAIIASGYRIFNFARWWPPLLMAMSATCFDYYTVAFAAKIFGRQIIRPAQFLVMTNPFHTCYSIRTFTNSLEATLTAVALYYWPYAGIEQKRSNFHISLMIIAMTLVLRPTAIVLWVIPGLNHWFNCGFSPLVALKGILAIVASQVITVGIDSIFYKKIVFTTFNFIQFNFLSNSSSFYGVHPVWWYFIVAVPVILGPFILFVRTTGNRVLLATVIFTISIFSSMQHKEVRFLYPLSPILFSWAASGLQTRGRKTFFFLFIACLPGAFYFTWVHQRGVIDVVKWLHKEATPNSSVFWAMPCHSTPYYDYLNRKDVLMDFIHCEPPVVTLKYPFNETDFFADIKSSLSALDYTYVITFECLQHQKVLETRYKECKRFFNTHFNGDERRKGDVIVWCRL